MGTKKWTFELPEDQAHRMRMLVRNESRECTCAAYAAALRCRARIATDANANTRKSSEQR